MAVLEESRKHRSMELFDILPPTRTLADYIGKVGILRKDGSKRMSVMMIPRGHKSVDKTMYGVLIAIVRYPCENKKGHQCEAKHAGHSHSIISWDRILA